MKHPQLWLVSPITWMLERLFAGLQSLSLASLLFGTREQSQALFTSPTKKVKETIRRSRAIEAYIVVWFVLDALAIAIIPWLSDPYIWITAAIMGYRVFDIVQTALNVNLFAPLRLPARQHYIASLARMVILAIWNFIEMVVCFAAIYLVNRHRFGPPLTTRIDGLYFSAITQLTIGYGDIVPLGSMRAVAPLQGLLGFLLALFALSRLVAFLPRTDAVFRDD
jgi:hypothetical protein